MRSLILVFLLFFTTNTLGSDSENSKVSPSNNRTVDDLSRKISLIDSDKYFRIKAGLKTIYRNESIDFTRDKVKEYLLNNKIDFIFKDKYQKKITIESEKQKVSDFIEIEEIGENTVFLKVKVFHADLIQESLKIFEKWNLNQKKFLIIDITGNKGGILNSVYQFADLFSPTGLKIFSLKPIKGKIFSKDSTLGAYYDESRKITIIVDEHTASGATLFAKFFQKNNLAKVIGSPTKTMDYVYSSLPLRNDIILKYRYANFVDDTGQNSISESSVIPDLVLEATDLDDLIKRDRLLESIKNK